MRLFLYLLINLLIVGLFLYSKLTPHKSRLTGSYLNIFNFFERIFDPLLNLLRKVAKPSQVGNGIAVDMSQIILLILLLLSLKFIL
jgi:uncharacterized protein YggT (Ycf19 family)